jgi:tRNA(Ile2) C34 agmatinyltransferase TiaS
MCFGGREDVEAKRSREIDALIHRDEKAAQKVVKLLLLGESICAANSVASTNTELHLANREGQALERVVNLRF